MNFKVETNNRVKHRRGRSLLDANTRLEHFAIISYKVPIERIQHLIPEPFKLWTFEEEGIEYALISAVPFKDKDFSFYKFSRFPVFNFFQTNFRTYIIDERDNSHAAWFFGTTLGSILYIFPKHLWNMPWGYGKYKFDHQLEKDEYSTYKMSFTSKQGNGIVDIKNCGKEMNLLEGFSSMDEQIHILTHPVTGYYSSSNDEIGTYEIWHPKMDLKEGTANELYFELFENLGLLTKAEMNLAHSVLITNEIEFDVLLPPKSLSEV